MAERQHSVFTTWQARMCGFSQSSIDRRVRSGLWIREHLAVFRICGARPTFESKAMAAVLAAGPGAFASFTTSGRLFGVDDLETIDVHVTVVGRRNVHVHGIVIHRPERFARGDGTRVGVIPTTSPGRTLIDLASMLSPSALEDAIDDLRRRDLIDVRRLARRVSTMSPHGRRGILLLRRLLLERVGQPVPGSNWERRLRELLVDAGLEPPVPQFEILDGEGNFVARPDLVYPTERLYIEFESEKHHGTRNAREHDLDRQNELVALGYAPLRVSKRQMTTAPDRVIQYVSARLAAARGADGAESPRKSRD